MWKYEENPLLHHETDYTQIFVVTLYKYLKMKMQIYYLIWPKNENSFNLAFSLYIFLLLYTYHAQNLRKRTAKQTDGKIVKVKSDHRSSAMTKVEFIYKKIMIIHL